MVCTATGLTVGLDENVLGHGRTRTIANGRRQSNMLSRRAAWRSPAQGPTPPETLGFAPMVAVDSLADDLAAPEKFSCAQAWSLLLASLERSAGDGGLMKARLLIQNASYGPGEVKALGEAFDDAWERIAPDISSRPTAIEAARLKLAEVVLGLAKNGNFDPKWVADRAIQIMCAPPQKLRP